MKTRRSAAIPSVEIAPADSRGGRRRSIVPCATLAAAVILVAGCSLPMPQAQSDPTKYFVLSVPAAATTPAEVAAPAVRLRPIELASYLRTRPIVVRRGTNEVEFHEFARWGEPLEQGISRVLREELLAQGRASAVDAGGLRPAEAGDVKFEISVRVLACEGLADGGVNFRAAWEVTSTAPNAGAGVRGEYHPTDLKWTPRNEATLAAALSRAVAGLADEIGSAIAKAK